MYSIVGVIMVVSIFLCDSDRGGPVWMIGQSSFFLTRLGRPLDGDLAHGLLWSPLP